MVGCLPVRAKQRQPLLRPNAREAIKFVRMAYLFDPW
jgi:hypothetical protein